MRNKRRIIVFLVVLTIGLMGIVSNHITYKAKALADNDAYYTRINFNVNSKTDTLPLSSVKYLFLANNLKPIRIWVLIDNDITAMFTFQKSWRIDDIDKIIAQQILKDYKVKIRNDLSDLKRTSKNKSSVLRSREDLIKQDERIVELFTKNPEVKVLAIDISTPNLEKSLLKLPSQIKQSSFSISTIPFSYIIPSPQMQWNSEDDISSKTSTNSIYSNPPPPDDSTWLPNHVSANVMTLQDSEQTRYISQQAEWYDAYRLSYFWNGFDYQGKHYDTAYEQDSVFYPDQDKNYYVADSLFWTNTMIEEYYTNLPGSYLDTRFGDRGDINLSVGAGNANEFSLCTLYYYDLYVKPGESNSGNTFTIQEQPSYHKFAGPDAWTIFGAKVRKQHLVDCDLSSTTRLFIPYSYRWNPCTNPH